MWIACMMSKSAKDNKLLTWEKETRRNRKRRLQFERGGKMLCLKKKQKIRRRIRRGKKRKSETIK